MRAPGTGRDGDTVIMVAASTAMGSMDAVSSVAHTVDGDSVVAVMPDAVPPASDTVAAGFMAGQGSRGLKLSVDLAEVRMAGFTAEVDPMAEAGSMVAKVAMEAARAAEADTVVANLS